MTMLKLLLLTDDNDSSVCARACVYLGFVGIFGFMIVYIKPSCVFNSSILDFELISWG